MIIRLNSSGRSFKGLAQYLCHDAGNANSAERVAWTQSLNCAHDDELSVVHEMYTTTLDADLLKQEAGGRAGYKPIQKPVKHVSLSWHASDEPTPEHMKEATQQFLEHMGWHEHQAFLVGHQDKEHPHVHIMINAVHPETGLKLDDRYEKRRAQDWGLEYERSQDRIHCEQRLQDADQREPQMSRDAWQAMKDAEKEAAQNDRRDYDLDYMAKLDNREVISGEEWKILKEYQRKEREAFIVENKELYKALAKGIEREVREEFRHDWAAYYADKRAHVDPAILALQRKSILEQQDQARQERRDEAMPALRAERNEEYDELKARHRDEKEELRSRQAEGLTSPHLLDLVNRDPERAKNDQTAEPVAPRGFIVDVASLIECAQPSRIEIDPALVGGRASAGFTDRGESLQDGKFADAAHEATTERFTVSYDAGRSENPFKKAAETVREKQDREDPEDRDRTYSSYMERSRD